MKYNHLPNILRHYANLVRWTTDHWLDGLPSVTIVLSTFGRPALLNEAVESVLRQDYKGHLETVILNDQPEVTIISDIENVRVVNKKKRYATLADKKTVLIGLGKTDLTMIFADDDILMPWAVTTAVSGMVSHLLYVILGHVRYNYKRNVGAYFPRGSLPGPMLFNNKVARKMNIILSHEYPGFEMQLVNEFHKVVQEGFGPLTFSQSKELPSDKVFYMARTNLPNHIAVDGKGYDACGEFVDNLGLSGEIKIEPEWERDYEAIFKKAIEKRLNAQKNYKKEVSCF